jgi:hypothetical protein
MRSILTTSIGIYCTLATLTAEGGDILRGGTSVGARPSAPRKAQMSPAQELATANAREALARTSRSIKAVQQMQAAARNLALRGVNNLRVNNGTLPAVPNGLKIGGLQVAPGVPQNLAQPTDGENPGLWIGALLPKETVSGTQTKVTIKQT